MPLVMGIRKSYLAKVTVLILSVLLLSGCWDRRELNTLAIIAGTGLDTAADPGKILLSVQIIRPGEVKEPGGGGGARGQGEGGGTATKGPAVRVTTSTGQTVYQAVRNFVTHTSRSLYFSHSQIIVIGKDAAKKGVYPLLDFFIRNPQPRPTTWVLVARGKAGDVLRAYDGIEKIDALGISLAVKTTGENAYAPAVTLQEFTERLMSRTTAPIATLVEIYEEVGFAGEKMKRVRPHGTAVFKGDRLAGELGLKETRGLMWVLGKVKGGIITLSYPGGRESLEIKRARSRIKPEIRAGRLHVKVEIEVESNLGDQDSTENLALPDRMAGLEKMQAGVVRNEVMAAVNKSKQLNADIFYFGEEFHRRYPGVWPELEARWNELYQDIKVDATVKSRVRDVGAIGEPLYRER